MRGWGRDRVRTPPRPPRAMLPPAVGAPATRQAHPPLMTAPSRSGAPQVGVGWVSFLASLIRWLTFARHARYHLMRSAQPSRLAAASPWRTVMRWAWQKSQRFVTVLVLTIG